MATETMEAPAFHENVQITDANAKDAFASMFATSPETKADFARVQKQKAEKGIKTEPVKPVQATEPEKKAEPKVEPAEAVEEAIVTDTPEETEETAEETTEPVEEVTDETKKQNRWSELKKLEKKVVPELKSKITAYETEIATLKADKERLETEAKEVPRFKTELEEAYKELQVSRIEKIPEFKQYVTEARNGVFDEMVQVATRSKVDSGKLAEALHKDSMGDSDALEAFMDESAMSERNRAKVYQLSDNLTQISKREKDLRDNSAEVLKAHNKKTEEQLQQHTEKVTKERQQAADAVAGKFKEKFSALLPEGHGLDFDAIKGDVQKFDTLGEGEKVYSSYAGYVLPKIIENYEKAVKELKEAKAQNVKLRSGAPKSTNGTAAPTNNGPKEAPKREDLAKEGYDGFAKGSMDRLFGRA